MTPKIQADRRPTLLLIGANGQVGWELRRTLASVGEVIAASLEGEYGPTIDLMDPQALARLIEDSRPDALINAAAYTAVDKAERDRATAQRVNAEAVGEMGALLAERGTPIIHYSTDFVFSGTLGRPYTEDDQPDPLNVYGETKLDGERALRDSGARALIFRTSWVYGARGQNFLLTMRRLFQEREELRVVDDQIGSPTWSRMLAEVTAQVLYRVLSGDLDLDRIGGLYHLTGSGQISWYGFAQAILEATGARTRLIPIPSSEYQAPARRPAFSVLDNTRFEETFGLRMPDWRLSLAQCLEEL
ncbi:dTDP-4-dehydrorhamnose reductase [Thermochromatium tepidum]|jgi:dTDP-4-dehydrorhamnose reductase (EC 1.1.1.133)|uniref:dTDP-4-dehydrorhamnose reductase n=1 Tax=Thermochromatium tepidum ATCC 43061 TaxID=316276 RepID=A0A6I6EAC7_THETI|nr:dTDP-4-dehydrorhamnose reductase [Thermochromatium tepidum]QGU33558.1 dTDP-4-dehydrorhamnose reductase [Thermochromatium tepidum ATCC 43061]